MKALRICILFILVIISNLLGTSVLKAEHVRGHFNYLSLMLEIATKDKNKRAINNINYILDTPNGEYFEVDNNNPPIESLITKVNKTKQMKPLAEVKDEDRIIYYFHKVDNFAKGYYPIVDTMITGKINPFKAKRKLQQLDPKFNDGAVYRALGVCKLAYGNQIDAISDYKRAIIVNKSDSKALILLSLGEYAIGNKDRAIKTYKKAIKLDTETPNIFWELQYAKSEKPELFQKWQAQTQFYYE